MEAELKRSAEEAEGKAQELARQQKMMAEMAHKMKEMKTVRTAEMKTCNYCFNELGWR